VWARGFMKKILVIGSGGAGKSTLARSIGERTGLEVIHLDLHYWKAGWIPTPDDAWRDRVRELVARDAWVMDGNYSGTLSLRIAAADTIVFLDFSRVVCMLGVFERRIRKRRSGVAPGCPEKLDWEFLRWVWTYPKKRRPKVLALLASVADEKRVIVLGSRRDARRFVASL
jgi:adenylate kinase family enzyme